MADIHWNGETLCLNMGQQQGHLEDMWEISSWSDCCSDAKLTDPYVFFDMSVYAIHGFKKPSVILDKKYCTSFAIASD